MNKNSYPMRAPEEYENRVQTIVPLLKNVLELLGEDIEREGLVKTPERWAKALLDYTKGMEQDPKQHLQVIFKICKFTQNTIIIVGIIEENSSES